MKKFLLMIGATLISISAMAHPSHRPHYYGENGRIVYSDRIHPEVNERTYVEGNRLVQVRTTRECVRVRENRNHLTCVQWRTSTDKRVVRGDRHDNRRYHDRYQDWNRG